MGDTFAVAGGTSRSAALGRGWTADDRRLRAAAAFFVVAVLVHNGDHLRRGGDSVSASVFWVGSLAILVEIAVVVLAFSRHPLAPIAAVAAGFGLAAGYVLVHFTPSRSFFSDSFVSGGASALSVTAALLETIAALGLALVGLDIVRRRGIAPEASEADEPVALLPTVVSTLRQPLVAIMVIGNLAIFIGSLATR